MQISSDDHSGVVFTVSPYKNKLQRQHTSIWDDTNTPIFKGRNEVIARTVCTKARQKPSGADINPTVVCWVSETVLQMAWVSPPFLVCQLQHIQSLKPVSLHSCSFPQQIFHCPGLFGASQGLPVLLRLHLPSFTLWSLRLS